MIASGLSCFEACARRNSPDGDPNFPQSHDSPRPSAWKGLHLLLIGDRLHLIACLCHGGGIFLDVGAKRIGQGRPGRAERALNLGLK